MKKSYVFYCFLTGGARRDAVYVYRRKVRKPGQGPYYFRFRIGGKWETYKDVRRYRGRIPERARPFLLTFLRLNNLVSLGQGLAPLAPRISIVCHSDYTRLCLNVLCNGLQRFHALYMIDLPLSMVPEELAAVQETRSLSRKEVMELFPLLDMAAEAGVLKGDVEKFLAAVQGGMRWWKKQERLVGQGSPNVSPKLEPSWMASNHSLSF